MVNTRKALSIDEKVALIRAIAAGEKIVYVCKRFGFCHSTVSTIWKNREKYLQAEKDGKSSKKLKKVLYEDLDEAMFIWYHRQRLNNNPVSGLLVKAKADKFSQELGLGSFKASEGWLGKFKKRHNVHYSKVSGETQSVDANVMEDWLGEVWPKLAEKYAPSDIFIAVEIGLFLKLTHYKTLKINEEENFERENMPKERITALLIANMSGTEKRKLLIIGKSKSPKCFENVQQLPVTYKCNKSAWMTSQIFEEELQKWDKTLNGRKILLLVDNNPSHLRTSKLQNIGLEFVSSTGLIQPVEQGVAECIKDLYKRKLLMELVESDGNILINMFHAVNFLAKAWEEVTTTTIDHSFRNAGLCSSCSRQEEETTSEFESQDTLSLIEWAQQFNMPYSFTNNLQVYLNVDNSLVTTASITDGEILDVVRKTEQQQDVDEEDETDDCESPPSIKQALDAAKLLEKYFLYNKVDAELSQDISKILKEIQEKYWCSKKRQIEDTDS